MSNLRKDTIVLENITLLSYESASKYLHKKFDVSDDLSYSVTDEWIFFSNLIPKYNAKGEHHVQNGPLYYDKADIENHDFENDPRFLSHCQMVPRTEIEGNIISGPEAMVMLKNKFPKVHRWTIPHILDPHEAFTTNKPNKNGVIPRNNNSNADYSILYYSEEKINNLNPSDDELYIDFAELMERDKWKALAKDKLEDACVNLLKKENREQKLKAINPHYYWPGEEVLTKSVDNYGKPKLDKDGKPIIERSSKLTSFYGYDAQQLIENKSALFVRSEILAIEENIFTKPEEREPIKSSTQITTEHLVSQECDQIKKGLAKLPVNKQAFAKRIYNKGINEKRYPENIKETRILRLFNYTEIKSNLKTSNTNSSSSC